MDMNVTDEEYMLLIGQLYVEKKKTEQILSAILRQKDEQSEINTKLVKRVKELQDEIKTLKEQTDCTCTDNPNETGDSDSSRKNSEAGTKS